MQPAALAQSLRGHATLFSSRAFVQAWVKGVRGRDRMLAIDVEGSGPPRTMYGVQTPLRWGSRGIQIGPACMYASPDWDGVLTHATLERIWHSVAVARTRHLIWNVRFDHGPLAGGLENFGLESQRAATQVLYLDADYERVFAGFSSTNRNQIRASRRRQVTVRASDSKDDLQKYYRIHLQAVERKGGYSMTFPIEFLTELLALTDTTRFLVAEVGSEIAAGGIFLRDGCSIFYMHGAYDARLSGHFPTSAILDDAIRWACESGAIFFNMGGSGGIASLEKFKASWGAQTEQNWVFKWTNPVWLKLGRLKEMTLRRGRESKRVTDLGDMIAVVARKR
jgi:lipid II:glycine glycyltransferase (peptidoglycan interpeptide bridge formation enzyme)